MGAGKMSRVLVLFLCFVQILAKIITPPVTIRALKPKGFSVSIPDVVGITQFVFEGSVNETIDVIHTGNIREVLTKGTDGRWFYQNNDLMLNLGDVIYYRYHYIRNKEGVHSHTKNFVVRDLVDSNSLADTPPSVNDCPKTLTVVRDMETCGGKIIFEDNFDSLREDLWRFEQYIAGEPDFAFVSYQHPQIARTISVEDGYLRIEPRLQQTLPSYSSMSILTGTLDLYNGCTSTSSNCIKQASGANILPPIVSGRMTTKSLAFTYGTIEIRAKLPEGDWLYPDILLKSIYEGYGSSNYDSGIVRIAGARGNLELKEGNIEYGNKVLYGGIMLNAGCRNHLINQTVGIEAWGKDFHLYTLRWTPETITLLVDGDEWNKVEPADSGLQVLFPEHCQLPRSMLGTGSRMAPFNEFFGITLGVAAGGILEFNDNLNSNGLPKPWKNTEHKNSYHFWQDMTNWWPTWRQPALIVDYVRVRAL